MGKDSGFGKAWQISPVVLPISTKSQVVLLPPWSIFCGFPVRNTVF